MMVYCIDFYTQGVKIYCFLPLAVSVCTWIDRMTQRKQQKEQEGEGTMSQPDADRGGGGPKESTLPSTITEKGMKLLSGKTVNALFHDGSVHVVAELIGSVCPKFNSISCTSVQDRRLLAAAVYNLSPEFNDKYATFWKEKPETLQKARQAVFDALVAEAGGDGDKKKELFAQCSYNKEVDSSENAKITGRKRVSGVAWASSSEGGVAWASSSEDDDEEVEESVQDEDEEVDDSVQVHASQAQHSGVCGVVDHSFDEDKSGKSKLLFAVLWENEPDVFWQEWKDFEGTDNVVTHAAFHYLIRHAGDESLQDTYLLKALPKGGSRPSAAQLSSAKGLQVYYKRNGNMLANMAWWKDVGTQHTQMIDLAASATGAGAGAGAGAGSSSGV
jgi:hypothetical protein